MTLIMDSASLGYRVFGVIGGSQPYIIVEKRDLPQIYKLYPL